MSQKRLIKNTHLKAKNTYLKGKSVFTVSILVVIITILTVYLTGVNYNRTVTSNLYLALTIIGVILCVFMSYGLYVGLGLTDNFPKFKRFKSGDMFSNTYDVPDVPNIDVGDGIGGLIVSIILWIGMSILFFVLLIVVEAIFWISLFIILAMLYWVFFRALKLVFSKSKDTQGNLAISIGYAIMYTVLYLSWLFLIVYLTEMYR